MLRANLLASLLALIIGIFSGLPDSKTSGVTEHSHGYVPVAQSVYGDLNKTVIGSISHDDFLTLARLISAESKGEPYEGQVAVGATVLNRVRSNRYPASIPDVVYQIESGRYQYSPVYNGQIYAPPTDVATKAAWAALSGVDPSAGALHFYNPAKTRDSWVRQQRTIKVIGNHYFAS